MSIKRLITENNIVFIHQTDKAAILGQLVDRAFTSSLIDDPTGFKTAVIQRENLVSTGIGLGVALPHAASPKIHDFFIITGLTEKPVPWNAVDGEPVRIIFLIGIPQTPADPQETSHRYLQLVAELMLLIKNNRRRLALLEATDPAQVLAVLLCTC